MPRGDTNKHNQDHMTPPNRAAVLHQARMWLGILELALTGDSTHQSDLSAVRMEELWSSFTLPPGLRPAGENDRGRSPQDLLHLENAATLLNCITQVGE